MSEGLCYINCKRGVEARMVHVYRKRLRNASLKQITELCKSLRGLRQENTSPRGIHLANQCEGLTSKVITNILLEV
jgi:hypothetical protein